VGGHTLGHVAYHLPAAGVAFVGDSLFALGCGRMFEGTAPQFWESLSRLKALPARTNIYCAHEYTANARFAVHADPDNAALAAYADDVARYVRKGGLRCPSHWSANWRPIRSCGPTTRLSGALGSGCRGRVCGVAEAKNEFI
jgi:glyoxylase-like metal-dependent hydrolase (beta-lactamase superfamily II)